VVSCFLWSFIASGRLARFKCSSGVSGGHGVLEISLMLLGQGDRPMLRGLRLGRHRVRHGLRFPLGAIWFLRGRGFARYIGSHPSPSPSSQFS